MKNKLYIAYGSNLNISQMKYRCPTAKLIGTGMLENYELQFKGMPNNSHATIAEKEGNTVPVGVWEILPNDEKSLDRYEGYPSYYFKKDIPVQMKDGYELNAMVYIMNLEQNFGLPSEHYYDTVCQGYLDCKLDINVLNKAVDNSAEKFYLSLSENNSFNFSDDIDNDMGSVNL